MEPARKLFDTTRDFTGKAAQKVGGFWERAADRFRGAWSGFKGAGEKIKAAAQNRLFMACGRYTKKAAQESSRLAKIGKAKYDLRAIERSLAGKHSELGKFCYELMEEEKLTMPELYHLKNEIAEIQLHLKEKNDHIEQIRRRAA